MKWQRPWEKPSMPSFTFVLMLAERGTLGTLEIVCSLGSPLSLQNRFFLLTYFSTVLSFEASPPLYSYYSLPILITVITHFQTTPPRSSSQAPGSGSSFTPQVLSQSSWLTTHREDPRNINGTVVWPAPYTTVCSTSPSLSQEIPHTLSLVGMAAFLRSRTLKLHSTSFL